MTGKELSQLYYLNREIKRDRSRLADLEAAAMNTVGKITGLPHGAAAANKPELAVEIADLKTTIGAKWQLCVVEYNRLMRYIADVDDSFMRQILMQRHIDGLSWGEIAFNIGGRNTADSVRKAHERFLKKN